MGTDTIQKTIDIDMRGQVCPACLLVAMDSINKNRKVLQDGEAILCIKTDNREATTTIPTTARNMGYSVTVEKMDTYYLVCVGILSQEGNL
jgi:TusA-related sulfurtransferase